MSNIATSIEQSKHLLELGLDPNTADMWWSNRFIYWQSTPMIGIATEQNQLYTFKWCEEDIPAWSLSALLEVIKGVFAYTTIAISGASKGFNFIRCKDLNYIWTHDVNADSPIGAAYEMVCLLLEQELIKKGDNYESKS